MHGAQAALVTLIFFLGNFIKRLNTGLKKLIISLRNDCFIGRAKPFGRWLVMDNQVDRTLKINFYKSLIKLLLKKNPLAWKDQMVKVAV